MNRLLLILIAIVACGDNHKTPPPTPDAPVTQTKTSTAHSGSIAISADGKTLYVVNADLDTVSFIDTASRAVTTTVTLAAPGGGSGGSDLTYTPAAMPRALALSIDGKTLWVTGERSGELYAIDTTSGTFSGAPVCPEPVGVVEAPDGSAVFVACSQDHLVAKVTGTTIAGTVAVGGEPWALGWAPDGSLLATLFLGPGIAVIDPAAMTVTSTVTLPDMPARPAGAEDPRLAHGTIRGIYDVATRPTTQEVWAPHLILGIDTAQPTLNFERTAFPGVSILANGAFATTLSTDAQDVPGVDGSFGDVVSGPHAIAFTHDGAFALVVDTNSEDVLVVGANRIEASLVRPLPGHMPEGIAIAPDDAHAYVDERNTGDVVVLDLTRGSGSLAVAVDGAPIKRYAADPMPAQVRLGQHMFYSANSDEYPITSNHWISCATCHLEGRTDAVTWKFAQGPRDTPTNAGGTLGTGFLFRTADRTEVQDYWHTINVEQGGAFTAPGSDATQTMLLDAITAYVNYGIPAPVPPTTDPAKVARGQQLFTDSTVGCSGCHSGPRFTDSGTGDPTLDLTQTPLSSLPLHDVGTCNTGGPPLNYPDVQHFAVDGVSERDPCLFDTPSLTGLSSSPPYLHDGSAPTIMDVLEMTRGKMGDITALSADDEAALVEYLRSL